jgi:hypothetical protein
MMRLKFIASYFFLFHTGLPASIRRIIYIWYIGATHLLLTQSRSCANRHYNIIMVSVW